jgi:hypothetical protein
MSPQRLTAAIALLAIAVIATSCGGDDEESIDTTADAASTAETTTDLTEAPTTEAETSTTLDGDYPCSLFDKAELESIIGFSLEPGDGITNNVSENDLSYIGQQCSWSATEGISNELRFQVSEADDFPSGAVGCPPPMGTTTPVTGVGTSATWETLETSDYTGGTLRVCDSGAFVEVVLYGPIGADQQQQAVQVAQLGLEAATAD